MVDNDTTSGTVQSAFAFATTGLLTSQMSYNLLINTRPKTSRLRPYFAVGPALQLMHLDDAPIKKAPSYWKLGLSNIGLLSAAYNFGSTPPLEGGGIFQVGFNYGGGVRYRVTPRWMIRLDYRETLTSQPDFWTKSKTNIISGVELDNATMTFVGPVFQRSHAPAACWRWGFFYLLSSPPSLRQERAKTLSTRKAIEESSYSPSACDFCRCHFYL